MSSDEERNIEEELKDFHALADAFYKFREQYEIDMRGDKTLNNGNRGIIGTVRIIQQYMKDYPSLTYVWSKHPLKVIAILVIVWTFLHTLYELGLLAVLEKIASI